MNPTDPNNPNSSAPSPFGGTPLPDHNSLTSTPPQPDASQTIPEMPAPSTFTPPPTDPSTFAPSTPTAIPTPNPMPTPSTFTPSPMPDTMIPTPPLSDPSTSMPPAMPADMSASVAPTDTFNPVAPPPGSTDLSSVLAPAQHAPMPDPGAFTPDALPQNAPPQPEPPASSIPPTSMNNPTMSSLDNPLGVPSQNPNFSWSNPGTTSSPTPDNAASTPGLTDLYGASTTNPLSQPQTPAVPGSTEPTQPSPIQGEPAPTDLSHLINTGDSPVYTPPLSQPETLVSPPNGGGEVPNVPTGDAHKGIPKWVIGVGVALLLVVAATSAYFILGIGKSPEPASIPATETTVTPPAINTPAVSPAPVTTSPDSGFGNLQGGTASATVSPSPSTPTSALERLRQQQAVQSPTP